MLALRGPRPLVIQALLLLILPAGLDSKPLQLRKHTWLTHGKTGLTSSRIRFNGLRARPLTAGNPPLPGNSPEARLKHLKEKLVVPQDDLGKHFNNVPKDELPECPKIIWDADGIDVDAIPTSKNPNEFLKVLEMKDLGISDSMSDEQQLIKIISKREEILDLLGKHGAVHLKSVPIARDEEGYQLMLQALGLRVCQDSLSRKSLEKGLHQVVGMNTPLDFHHDRSDYSPAFVLHDEKVENPRMPRYSAFVCFIPATQGGEFQLLDLERMVREMDRSTLRKLYERRFCGVEVFGLMMPQSIINMVFLWAKNVLPTNFSWKWKSFFNPEYKMRSYFKKLPKGWNDISASPLVLTYFWFCEILIPKQSPINRHPETGEVVWFNNLLFWEGDRKRWNPRWLKKYPDFYVPRSKVVYGDGEEIPRKELDHIVELAEKNKVNIPMVEGDVVLVDNYRAQHGRERFKSRMSEPQRLHAISSGQDFTATNTYMEQLKKRAAELSKGDGMSPLTESKEKIKMGEPK